MGNADERQAGAAGAGGAGAHESPAVGAPACPACGARARRAEARYCATCGRHLRERDYRPADALRASYRWPGVTPHARRPHSHAVTVRRRTRNEQTARGYVFLTYAFLPLVGLVFCVCAFACCAAGLRDARLEGRAHAAAEARRGAAYAVLLAGAQVFIWLVAFVLPWRALS